MSSINFTTAHYAEATHMAVHMSSYARAAKVLAAIHVSRSRKCLNFFSVRNAAISYVQSAATSTISQASVSIRRIGQNLPMRHLWTLRWLTPQPAPPASKWSTSISDAIISSVSAKSSSVMYVGKNGYLTTMTISTVTGPRRWEHSWQKSRRNYKTRKSTYRN